MKKLGFIVLVLVTSLSSCRMNQYVVREVDVDRNNIQMTPMVVDVRPDFSRRINEQTKWCKTADEAAMEARYMAITQGNIDVVVDPILQIERRPAGNRKYRANLTGFAGFYQNARTVYEDMKAMREFSREDIEKYLIFKNPEVLKYMNAEGKVVNIYKNGEKAAAKPAVAAPAPAAPKVAPAPAPAPVQDNKAVKSKSTNKKAGKKK